jgi:hypothetical protein
MTKHLITIVIGTMIAVFVGIAVVQAGMLGSGMSGGQMSMGQSLKAGEDSPSEQSNQMPMTPEFAARMMNACINAMEGMAQMGRMMGPTVTSTKGLTTVHARGVFDMSTPFYWR